MKEKNNSMMLIGIVVLVVAVIVAVVVAANGKKTQTADGNADAAIEQQDDQTADSAANGEQTADADSENGSGTGSTAGENGAEAGNVAGENGAGEGSTVGENGTETGSATGENAATDAGNTAGENTGTGASSGNNATIEIPSSEISAETISFQAVTLDGQPISQSVFSDYDLTIMHMWGTFCGPCIREMGSYASFYKEKPDNVNLIGIVCDVYDPSESTVYDAKDILSGVSADFVNICTSEDVYNLTYEFQYVPSCFFVDREGHIVGKMMDGASYEDTIARLNTYIK